MGHRARPAICGPWACIMYECAAGKPPFSASSLTKLVQHIMAAEPASIAGATPGGQIVLSLATTGLSLYWLQPCSFRQS